MKRRIFTFLLAAALVLLTACSSRGQSLPSASGRPLARRPCSGPIPLRRLFRRPTPWRWSGWATGWENRMGISHHLLQGRRGEILQGAICPGSSP